MSFLLQLAACRPSCAPLQQEWCLGGARAENTQALHAPLCREFLQRKYAGLMEVEVKAASGLPAADVSHCCFCHKARSLNPASRLPLPFVGWRKHRPHAPRPPLPH